jgi:hypothetical protein
MNDKQPRSLDASPVQRQNILNNPYAVAEIQKAVAIQVIAFEGDHWLLKEQVASLYGVDPRTIERICADNESELGRNGYALCRGKRLKGLKLAIADQFGPDIDVETKTTVLGIFSFRAFLNIGMLLTDSQTAKQLRQMMLDIVTPTSRSPSHRRTPPRRPRRRMHRQPQRRDSHRSPSRRNPPRPPTRTRQPQQQRSKSLTGLSPADIRTHLKALVATGQARTEGQKRSTRYISVS